MEWAHCIRKIEGPTLDENYVSANFGFHVCRSTTCSGQLSIEIIPRLFIPHVPSGKSGRIDRFTKETWYPFWLQQIMELPGFSDTYLQYNQHISVLYFNLTILDRRVEIVQNLSCIIENSYCTNSCHRRRCDCCSISKCQLLQKK